MASEYIHGTSDREQARLVRQAEILRQVLLDGLDLAPGERVLEIGCGVGAVLGELARAEPGLVLTGLDRSAEQLAGARRHLEAAGVRATLVEGDALALPFADGAFDRVVLVWFLEHLPDEASRLAALREARRVLRRGGRIDTTETDYGLFRATPRDEAVDAFLSAFVACFNRHGDAHVGPRVASLLERAGFVSTESRMHGLHFWTPSRRAGLEAFTAYVLDFVEPELGRMTEGLDPDARALVERGAARFRALAARDDASFSATIWRTRATV
jgi:ubiquinone/menaquinone biosynthesis C-methylase UbiE